jgi:hypothetical protein
VLNRKSKFNYNINDFTQKKEYKNPRFAFLFMKKLDFEDIFGLSIYEMFIERFGIDEYGSSFPDVSCNINISYIYLRDLII